MWVNISENYESHKWNKCDNSMQISHPQFER